MNMNEKIKTNADRIRAMTDEELAKKASRMSFCAGCPVADCDFFRDIYACKDAWLDWLRSPAESEGETP